MTSANVVEYSINKDGKNVGYYRQNILCKSHHEELLKYEPLKKHIIVPWGYNEEEERWEGKKQNLEKFLRNISVFNKEIREYFKILDNIPL